MRKPRFDHFLILGSFMSTPRIRNEDRGAVARRRSLKGADLLRDYELLGGTQHMLHAGICVTNIFCLARIHREYAKLLEGR